MHLLVREQRSLDDDAPAQEPGHDPAPLLALSFSDADLGVLAAAWTPALPPLRLVNLATLRHPLSVDLYLERIAAQARGIVVRLLGGLDYWRYGAEELAALARAKGIALALLPGDGADDTRLRGLSTVDAAAWDALDAAFRAGGRANMALALEWLAHAGGLAARPVGEPQPVPPFGDFSPSDTALPPSLGQGGAGGGFEPPMAMAESRGEHPPTPVPSLSGRGVERPKAAIILYRSHLLSADTAPIEALVQALTERGLEPHAFYVDSLKSPPAAAWIAGTLAQLRPAVILNATAFSARQDEASPLDGAGVPVLQLVLAGSTEAAWARSSRGLSPADLAMHVVLPELDGRLLTSAISFKTALPPDPALQYARTVHAPYPDGIALAAGRAAGWARLGTTPRAARRLAVLLSDYPGIAGQQGHAVGLDSFASLAAMLRTLHAEGYATEALAPAALVQALCHAPAAPFLSLAEYRAGFVALPASLRDAVTAAWGAPEDDPACIAGQFTVRHHRAGQVLLALQPDRGTAAARKASYHDPDLPPRHAYIAFHLWLRGTLDVHALVQLGAHGSLEWLPGKAAALSPACAPAALLGGLPVVYPFIVNNPGEAAAAKRRLGAVTIGHLTPPVFRTTPPALRELERLIDEYAAADGLDRRRMAILRQSILDRAAATGLLAESGVAPDAEPDEALTRLDAYLCDVKDLQLRDGLHVFGAEPAAALPPGWASSPAAERQALLDALDARFVAPGPAGSPSRGRLDVLPTGRNLTTMDPRAIPSRSALVLAERAAGSLLRRHVREHGDWPRALVLDLWGSTTMRTGGEDLALAYLLLGARPVWDEASTRVSGFEIVPLAVLDRPRIDVTLRISGLFRDAFEGAVAQFDALVRAIAALDEAGDWNPLAEAARGKEGAALRRATIRVYGAPSGRYGAGDATGESWLAASAGTYGKGLDGAADPAALTERLAGAAALIHIQDHAEQDLLDSPEWAVHQGGFAQAAHQAGAAPALYQLDTSVAEAPRPRLVAEEIARVVRGRAANPAWIAGQMRHGYRGAAEIARPLAALEAYARTLGQRFDAQFTLIWEATLGDASVSAFLQRENPAAHADMAARFEALRQEGFWHPRRNFPGP